MSAENLKDLSRADILRLLDKLDANLAEHGERAVIYVVGGANIALAVDATRSTTDIDVVVKRGTDVVFAAAHRVAQTEPGLGDDWLNNQFTGGTDGGGIAWSWFDNKDADTPSTLVVGKGLTVQLASPSMMLALKTLAGRPQDLRDIYTLMRMTGVTTPQELGRNLARYTGRRIFDQQGQPGMWFHIDPEFREIFDQAPQDLRPIPGPSKAPGLRDGSPSPRPPCGHYRAEVDADGREVRRLTQPCTRPQGHWGPHRVHRSS